MNDFETKVIEAIAVLQTQVQHVGERLDAFLRRQDLHEERLDRLERRIDGHGERLTGLESTNGQILTQLEPVKDSAAFWRVVKWLGGALVLAGGVVAAVLKMGGA